MGYFNYYFYKKFIRTFVNSLFKFFKKHKKIAICLLAFLIYVIINNKCFGFNVEYNDIVYDVPDLPFSTEEHPDFVFGTIGTNRFGVGYPAADVANDKFFFTDTNTVRYNITGTSTYGEWYWYDLTIPTNGATIGNWSAQKLTTHGFLTFNSTGSVIISSVDIYASSTSTDISFVKNSDSYFIPDYIQASFVSTREDLETSGNDKIIINPGSFANEIELRLYNTDANILLFSTPLSNYDNYVEREDLENPFSNLVYKIPYDALPSFTLQNGVNYAFRLIYFNEQQVITNISLPFTANGDITGGGTDNTTNTDINNSIKNTNQKLENIEETITDSTIDVDVENDLPSVDVQDPTQQGIDNIFNSIYNAFCTGEAQDIILPIPYTEKNITISPYYVKDMLNNNGVGWLYTFIQAFWSYLFGRFIIKDISNKINKIKSGDIDNIQNTNIKEDML